MRKLRKAKALASLATFAMFAALLVPLFSQPALAQGTTGSIRGAVTDQTGAVVPEAGVVAKNQATGVETAPYKTTGDGIYNIPNLTPGTYTITVEAANFKRAVFTDIQVGVGQEVTIDAALQPGGLTETVTVAAGSEEVVNRETAQVSANFDTRKVAELPSNAAGAGIDTLALLAPGVLPGFGNVNSNGTTLSVNGQRSRSNNFSIDGTDNNDLSIGGPSYFVSNQDLVQDFQVITNNFSAQYGRNQGAIVNIVTKGGGNEFHGTAFWHHVDRKLFGTLNNLERRAGDEEAPPLLYNVYGGTVGGPIKRDKAFFFGSFQGIRTRETVVARGTGLSIVSSELERFRNAFPGNPIAGALANFTSFAINDFGTLRPRTDLGNEIETVTVNGRNFQVGGPFDVVLFPIDFTRTCNAATLANCQGFQAAFPEREFQTGLVGPTAQEEFTIKSDWKITDKDDIQGRYLWQDNNFADNLGGSNGFTGDVPASSKNLGATWTRQLSSTSLNEFRFSFTRLSVIFGGGCEGLQGCITDPTGGGIGESLANITFNIRGLTTGSAIQTIGPATNLPQGRVVDAYQFNDNFSLTRGRHQMVMGADIRRLRNAVPFLPNINGAFVIGSATNFINNSPQQVTLAAGEPEIKYFETDQFYFFQDDWKVKDNLTLNLGVRYEYIGQPINTLNEITVDRESNADTALWKLSLPLEARTIPKLAADKNNWAPRLGFAYTPRFGGDGMFGRLLGEDATVIRGGYSIAYDPPFYNILLNISTAAPVVFNNITGNPATPTAANPTLFPFPDPVPVGSTVRAFAEDRGLIIRGVADPRFQSQTPVASDFHLPYAQQWSLGIQRQINRNNVAEIRYVGTHAVGLFQSNNVNPRIDRLLNGFTVPAAGAPGGVLTFPGFPNLVPAGLTPAVAGTGACINDPATPFINESNNCNGRVLAGRGRILARENTASSIYHGLQTRYNGRLGNQLTLGASYTFSKALDNSSEIFAFAENAAVQNPFNRAADRSYSAFDRRHGAAFNALWDLPFFKDQKGIIGHIAGGWQINGTHVITSGRRWTPSQFFTQTLAANFAVAGLTAPRSYTDPLIGDTNRPFYGNPNAPSTSVGLYQWDAFLLAPFINGLAVPVNNPSQLYSFADFNQGVLTPISANDVRYIFNGPGAAVVKGTPFGDVPRNIEQGPRLNQMNLGIFKNTRITERVTIQFRTEMFNALNHPNPGYGFPGFETVDTPDRFVEDAGQAGFAFADFTDMQLARRFIQFGLRVIF
ncbi:MAG TPA: TonB-dependent receptor [Blastocatellia bacterium]|nr:TonB-dependent receptor [Blastocatellia bacterium]